MQYNFNINIASQAEGRGFEPRFPFTKKGPPFKAAPFLLSRIRLKEFGLFQDDLTCMDNILVGREPVQV